MANSRQELTRKTGCGEDRKDPRSGRVAAKTRRGTQRGSCTRRRMARATHTCNDVYQVENKVKFLTAEALRGVNSTIFDAQSSWLANVLGKRDNVTGTALEQGCDLDKAVVVQRQAPMVQTVLKAQRLSSRRSSATSSTSLSRRRGSTLVSQTLLRRPWRFHS